MGFVAKGQAEVNAMNPVGRLRARRSPVRMVGSSLGVALLCCVTLLPGRPVRATEPNIPRTPMAKDLQELREQVDEACRARKQGERRARVGQTVDRLLTDNLHERWRRPSKLGLASGWAISLPSGRLIRRDTLQHQAEPIIALGKEAVPHLFKWVQSDNLAVRFIAVYALEQITGLESHVPTFDQEDRAGNRARAIEVWREWYAQQP
jgi:hypothetical protein